ncbi:MAG TPA: SPOR domain-containing protein [Accumulibacter sp.]|uniref:SPOR domain-containing protein n=1 Tax=Accumulibacter sp. TaxID=2053492 RepID=UPI002B6DD9B8|nr:hypothetical protein [Accumulibacter sp.]HMW63911.1 SPOR domain-containing protein [Accumulibacter sp.]
MAVQSAGDETGSSPAPEPPVGARASAPDGDGQAELKRQLLRRMGVAGMLIVVLLSALAIFDYLNTQDEAMVASTQFTEPVPVRRKEAPAATVAPPPPVEQAAEPAPTPPVAELPAAVSQQAASASPSSSPPPSGQPVAGASPAGASRAPVARVPAELPAPARAVGDVPKEAPPLAPSVASAVPPAQPAVALPRTTPGYTLQSDLLLDVRRAESLQAQLAQEGIPATVETRLRIGPFRTRAEVAVIRRRLKELGVETAPLAGKAR